MLVDTASHGGANPNLTITVLWAHQADHHHRASAW